MGLFSRTLSRIDEIKRSLTRETGPRQFLVVADEHRRQGRPREAIEVLESGLQQSPASVAGHVALGRLLLQTEQLEKAVDSFQTALTLDPQNLVAIRQLAEVHLARGEKIDAVKKLKLFRGLSPGDREVAELIRQLDAELAPPPSPRSGIRLPVPVPPVPPVPALATETSVPPEVRPTLVDAPAAPAATSVELPPTPVAEPGPGLDAAAAEEALETESPGTPPFAEVEPESTRLELLPEVPAVPPSEEIPGILVESPTVLPDGESPEADTGPGPFEEGASAEVSAELSPSGPPASAGAMEEPLAAPEGASLPIPVATETMAGLLRAQGHLGRAREAYLALARAEADPAKVSRYLEVAAEIAATRNSSVRGRLEAWVEPFARDGRSGNGDLVTAVEEIVERLAPAAALVTDLEGVPVVTVGSRLEADAMESLSAELTAFWKNVRRARADVGEGALRSLVLKGSAGTAAMQAITTEYALLLKTGAGVPVGRIRFEAARAAEQLRPALL